MSGDADRAWFSYLDEPPSAWREALLRRKSEGTLTLRTPILWGAHESLQGVRDFSKCSRLRLERFFTQAHAAHLKLEIVLGFPPEREAFPAWTLRLPRKSWVPSSLWSHERDTVALCEIPSLFCPELSSAFCEFLSELLPILALYRAPEGPIEKVSFDLGIYRADLNALDCPEFTAFLESRYPSLEAFNFRYQCAFRQFASAATRNALRVLADRRPWLAAYDYKWCREQMLRSVEKKVLSLDALAPLRDILSASADSPSGSSSSEWSILIDPTLVETTGSRTPHLFLPAGFVHPSAVQTFRLATHLVEMSEQTKTPLAWLPSTGNGGLSVVVCGKYVSQRAISSLDEAVMIGARYLFPFGLPQYDENMAFLSWLSYAERKDCGEFVSFRKGAGTVWALTSPLTPAANLWDDLSRTASRLRPGETGA